MYQFNDSPSCQGHQQLYFAPYRYICCTMCSLKSWRRFLHSITILSIDFFALELLVTRLTTTFASSSTTIFATPSFFAITNLSCNADNSAMTLVVKSIAVENPTTRFLKASQITPLPPTSLLCWIDDPSVLSLNHPNGGFTHFTKTTLFFFSPSLCVLWLMAQTYLYWYSVGL